MPVTSTHPEYDEHYAKWDKCRTFIAGSDSVKEAGETYLARLSLQDDDEYEKYKELAIYTNYSARTLEGLMGMLFRKPPTVVLPENPTGELEIAVEAIETDADLRGSSISQYSREVANEILTVGRGGTLIDFSKEENHAYLSYYSAESIINWRVERINGRMTLSLVVLQETQSTAVDSILGLGARSDKDLDPYQEASEEQIRVLRLVPQGDETGEGNNEIEYWYRIEIWTKQEEGEGKKEKVYWELTEIKEPVRKGAHLTRIPFVFHNPETEEPTIDKPPLLDVVDLNCAHYRVSADFGHGLHFVALPTAWASGVPKESTLRIGSSEAWVFDNPEARAGYLEFTGKGLGEYTNERDRLERQMAVLGARMLEEQKRAAETVEAQRLRQGGEISVLQHISEVVSEQVTLAMRWVLWWSSTKDSPEDWEDDECKISLNRDFVDTKLPSADLVNLTTVWIQGGISTDTYLWNLAQGETLPPGRTPDEEKDLIANQEPIPGKEGVTIDDGEGEGEGAEDDQ
jgi:hypothetical protein